MCLFVRREICSKIYELYEAEIGRSKQEQTSDSYIKKLEEDAGEFRQSVFDLECQMLDLPARSLVAALLKFAIAQTHAVDEIYTNAEATGVPQVFDDIAAMADAQPSSSSRADGAAGPESTLLASCKRYWALDHALGLATTDEEENDGDPNCTKELVNVIARLARRIAETPAKTGAELAAKLRVMRFEATYPRDKPFSDRDDEHEHTVGLGLWTAIEDAERMATTKHAADTEAEAA